MNSFHLFSFLPILIFTTLIWFERILTKGHDKKSNALIGSTLFMVANGLLQATYDHFPQELLFLNTQSIMTFLYLYFIGLATLEYSIHSKRIDKSYLSEDFNDRLKYLKIPFLLLTVILLILYISPPLRLNEQYLFGLYYKFASELNLAKGTIYPYYTKLLSSLFVLLLLINLAICLFQLFNLLTGVIRKRNYPFVLMGLVGLYYTVVIIQKDGTTHISLIPFFILNSAYIVRVVSEYFFWNNYHLRKELKRQDERVHNNTVLLKKVINSPEDEEKHIIQHTIDDALSKIFTRLILPEYQFTGIIIYRCNAQRILEVENPEHITGYCTPMKAVENIKNMSREKINEIILKTSYDLEKLEDTELKDITDWGESIVKRVLNAPHEILIEQNIPRLYLGLQRLLCAVPISDHRSLTGMIILYKDSFNKIYPSEMDVLTELSESLGLIFQIMDGKEYQKERSRLQSEMETAKNIQVSILPRTIELPGYETAAFMETATEVGGDVYDIINTPFGNYLGIGDVTGHGLASGMVALMQLTSLHSILEVSKQVSLEFDIDTIYDIVNTVLCTINRDRIGSDKFMTQNYFVEKEGYFLHSGAHEIGLLYHKETDSIEELTKLIRQTGYLGLSEYVKAASSVGEFFMSPGDVLILYTDGVIEAKNQDQEQFGLERLKDLLMEFKDLHPKDIIEKIRDRVKNFAKWGDVRKNEGQFADDFTMIVLRKLPEQPKGSVRLFL